MNAKKISSITNAKIIEELKTFPNQAFIWSIVHRDNPNIWELPSKQSVMLIEPYSDEPFVFIAGKLSAQDIEAIIKLCPGNYPRVYCNNLYHPDFLKKGWDFHLRVELSYDGFGKSIELDEGWRFAKIDNIELFKQCYWYEKCKELYSSPELFLKSKIAYALCHNDKVISEVYLEHHSSSKHAEFSIVTNPLYRGRGAGTKIAAYVAAKCKEQGLEPIWSCQVDNRASLHTALSAGFKIKRSYINMVPEVGNTLSPVLEKWINENTPINWNQ